MNKSYVIRAGRFTEAQKDAYNNLSPRYLIPYKEEKINFIHAFGNANPVIMEIGFGMGAATALIAEANPDKNYLGIEAHKPGVGKLLWEMEKRALNNIRIIEFDAVQVAEKMIPKDSLDAIHIFFPDPWPKKKHRKRRLIQRPFANELFSRLKNGGYLYMATDWEDYAISALEELSAATGAKNAYGGFAPKQEWRPETKFEKKGIAKGHKIFELFFKKISS